MGNLNSNSRISNIKYYPTDDRKFPLTKKKKPNFPHLRTSITPGTILIVLSGRYKGKRVVFLKQLTSGLLLITGPFKLDGVPLRRVNQAYVISTSTKLDLNNVNLTKIDDFSLKNNNPHLNKKNSSFFWCKSKLIESKNIINNQFKEIQRSIDSALIKEIKLVPQLKNYISSLFTLTKNARPHLMNF